MASRSDSSGLPEREGEDSGPSSLPGRVVSGGARRASRLVGATGMDRAVEAALEDAIVRAVESEVVERAVARVLQGPAVEEAVSQALRSEAVEKAAMEALDSEMVDRVWSRVLASDETQRLIERIAEAPEVRNAITEQGFGLIDDLGREVRRVTRRLDDALELLVRRLTFRRAPVTRPDHVGVVTRVAGLLMDGVIVNFGFLGLTSLFDLFMQALDSDFTGFPAVAVGSTTWILLASLYLFLFWSLSGQTPGMRFLDVELLHRGDRHIGAKPALKRLLGFWIAWIPFGLGFLGVLLRGSRQGLHDRLAGTEMVYEDPPIAPHADAEQAPIPAGAGFEPQPKAGPREA